MSNISQDYQSSRIISYSPAYTLVPTHECYNRCTYCNFRVEPGQSPWMTPKEAQKRLEAISHQGVIEILILSGEVHPASSRRQAWLDRIYDLGKLALEQGYLPHTNAGPLSFEEMAKLKEVNVSMGLMLEQVTPRLLETVHRHAPSKLPQVRLQQLEWAGQLKIPFTTGLLLGIGESAADWEDSLKAIALSHRRWQHIQEVILQPHSPGSRQTWNAPSFDLQQLPAVVATARRILPPEITLQIPPNLITRSDILLACIEAGARDLGGIGPIDEVNPDYPHHHQIAAILAEARWQLTERLPIYPQYDHWLSEPLQKIVSKWRQNINID
ncbi:MAG TPA: 7,8-didemethyl-8-hydroxy-5-deazariboflavin synthase subunit CofG [Oscillatoriaceae cyanobacterium M33_DOE_052]|uniref:7,8-didemethyl-8-hydroxy-5-deazariboflavin synthase n=1 Tax=Planktothricoides sp. SpSt-374 TaxID=2282167 RepID=A0A7C3VL54_9CYAN|nr:7,8-didemethyl-8-hydroxy-5-deazariboflavin synthase subunit CofG [Oscillatoriaceae cyanobacterium M33_DOE_052]